jgi:hypothetical protein
MHPLEVVVHGRQMADYKISLFKNLTEPVNYQKVVFNHYFLQALSTLFSV